MTQQIIFNQVASLFIMIITGFILRKTKILNKQANRTLSELLLSVTAPMMIIISFQLDLSKEQAINALIVFLLSGMVHLVCALAGQIVYKKLAIDKQQIFKVSTVLSNAAFMGFGILESIFGQVGLFYGSIYLINFNLFLWTYGVMVFEGKQSGGFKKAIVNPGTISVLIGLVLFVTQIKLPNFAVASLKGIGGMTTPIAMIVIGSFLAESNYKEMLFNPYAWLMSGIRLLVIPILTWAVLLLIPVDQTLSRVLVTIVAMPVATTTAIFAERYDGNSRLSAEVVSLSTLLSMITIPIILLIIQ